MKTIETLEELREIIESIQDTSIQTNKDKLENFEKYYKLNQNMMKDLSCLMEDSNIKKFPLLDTSNTTNMDSMFRDCTSLITIPLLDTSKVTNMYSMFNGCERLESIPKLDVSSLTCDYLIFDYCPKLKEFDWIFVSDDVPGDVFDEDEQDDVEISLDDVPGDEISLERMKKLLTQ